MLKISTASVVALLTGSLLGPAAGAKNFLTVASAEAQEYFDDHYLSRRQLENLLAPVALYPDPLLAQILVAATFADEVEDAAHWLGRYSDPYGIDHQPWDVSVKAVAHYPSVLNMMADRIDWTVALGQAYVTQPDDVMASVQRLRWMAHSAGNLQSNDYLEIVPAGEFIEIVPLLPDVVYVPVYEPEVIFFQPGIFLTFGPAYPIGAWLNRDFDWHRHRIYYHGWRGGRRWIERSRPRVRITNVYVDNRFRQVRFNRDVVRRNVNVENLNRFRTVHRDVTYSNLERRNARERHDFSATAGTNRRDRDGSTLAGPRRGQASVEQWTTQENRSPRIRERLQRESLETKRSRPREETASQPIEKRSFRTRQQTPPETSGDRRVRAERTARSRQPQDERRWRAPGERSPAALDGRSRARAERSQQTVEPRNNAQRPARNRSSAERGIDQPAGRGHGEAVQARGPESARGQQIEETKARGKRVDRAERTPRREAERAAVGGGRSRGDRES